MKLFKYAYINLSEKNYLLLVIILAPCLNLLPGLVIDMYSPSMPQIALNFHTSDSLVKDTITAVVIGFAIGAVILGILFDTFGRKKIIIVSLFVFIITSILAPFSSNIYELILIRFIQGFTTVGMSVGARVVVADHFSGSRLTVALLYASFSFGVGLVIAPYIGGYLQDNFGWHANFYAFTIFGTILLILNILFIHERFERKNSFSLRRFIQIYKNIVANKFFLSGVVIIIFTQLQLMFYPTIGPFIVEQQLKLSAITYGKSALLIGLGYLIGTITNRILLALLNQKNLLDIGHIILILAAILQLILANYFQLALWNIVLPIMLTGFAIGFLIGNISSTCIRLFPQNVGIVNSLQAALMTLFAGIGNFWVSNIQITNLFNIFWVFFIFMIAQVIAYISLFRNAFK